jgi:RNA recognition motif-containing protein
LLRGFGFVEMADFEEVAVAYGLLNNTMLNGQKVRIERDPSLRKVKLRAHRGQDGLINRMMRK